MRHNIHSLKGAPSPWITRFEPLIPKAPEGVLDLACGGGRHTRFLRSKGHRVTAVDRDTMGVADVADDPGVDVITADLETGGPWPLGPTRFAGLVVANYLHRPLFDVLVNILIPGGVMLYETFARGNERFGRPSEPAFLLHPGELLSVLTPDYAIVAFEQGEVASPKAGVVQRVCAIYQRSIAPDLGGACEPWPLPST